MDCLFYHLFCCLYANINLVLDRSLGNVNGQAEGLSGALHRSSGGLPVACNQKKTGGRSVFCGYGKHFFHQEMHPSVADDTKCLAETLSTCLPTLTEWTEDKTFQSKQRIGPGTGIFADARHDALFHTDIQIACSTHILKTDEIIYTAANGLFLIDHLFECFTLSLGQCGTIGLQGFDLPAQFCPFLLEKPDFLTKRPVGHSG